jgi:hypothetical protein
MNCDDAQETRKTSKDTKVLEASQPRALIYLRTTIGEAVEGFVSLQPATVPASLELVRLPVQQWKELLYTD